MAEIKTFVFLDSETTGLPSLENNTRITELCLVAVESAHIRLGVYPRIQNKLNLCFNPKKHIQKEASDITGQSLYYVFLNILTDSFVVGLTNVLLEYQPEFTDNIVVLICRFLELQPKPLCLVAHNGNRFDYPILRAEVSKTGLSLLNDILCIDSLEMFKDLQKQQQHNEFQNSSCSKAVPVEFLDGYDELLVSITEEVETNLEFYNKKNSVEQVQKMNETTPKKKSLTESAFDDFVENCSAEKLVKKRLNFG